MFEFFWMLAVFTGKLTFGYILFLIWVIAKIFLMTQDVASRLRELRDGTGLTVADMAERTGLPKRTLDKYMLRSNPSLPGFDALIALSKGLGVSLDWLVLGKEFSAEGVELLAQMAAAKTSLQYFETLLCAHANAEREFSNGEEILGLTPEEWSFDMGARVGEAAKELAIRGITRQELLTWTVARKERGSELARDRFNRLLENETGKK
jgi:transcriptional regulator with XRE-family HTH domain